MHTLEYSILSNIHRVSEKTVKIVFVRTSSNCHQLW